MIKSPSTPHPRLSRITLSVDLSLGLEPLSHLDVLGHRVLLAGALALHPRVMLGPSLLVKKTGTVCVFLFFRGAGEGEQRGERMRDESGVQYS